MSVERPTVSLWRKLKNQLALSLLWAAAGIAVVPLLSVFFYVVKRGGHGLTWEFLTTLPRPVGEEGGGLANAILGTLTMVTLASLVATPWGVAVGIYLSEYRHGKLARWFRMVASILASVPSIVIGIFAYALFVIPLKSASALAGAAALTFLMVPVIARSTEEVLKLVPAHIKEAGLALGLPRWKVTLRIIVKGNLSPIFTGILLAIARASGESAPLIFTSMTSDFWPHSLVEPTAALPEKIYRYAASGYETWQNKAWTGALVLLLIVFSTNVFTRILLAPSKGKSS